MKLIECVPNFSEGRNPGIIEAIQLAIAQSGATLLAVDSGAAAHRTVITFAGPPRTVEVAAFEAISKAAELIDMSQHQGAHPRIGATDVCPFVPLQGATMDDCVALARSLGQRVGEELGIPVYLYGEAAARPERRLLPDIRRGEYEGLATRLADPEFAPDFGPSCFNPRSGATAIGAREFLIAWNINLNTNDAKLAERIAAELRESGRRKLPAHAPGRFKELQARGWHIEEYGRAQIACNLTNYRVTSLHAVFDACREEAVRLGLRVTGSELVGLVPLPAILAAGDHYLIEQGRTTDVPELERVRAAVLALGLEELGPFDPQERILEYRYRVAHGHP